MPGRSEKMTKCLSLPTKPPTSTNWNQRHTKNSWRKTSPRHTGNQTKLQLTALINLGNKRIATRLKLADRINRTAENEAFITLKDHKPNFRNKPTCRLINPSKSEIGIISKQKLESINDKVVRQTLQLNQWKNTNDRDRVVQKN